MTIAGHYTADGAIVSADGTSSFVPGGNGFAEFVATTEAAGDTIAPYVAPPPALPDLQPYQFRAMLALSGNADKLNAYISGLSDPAKTIAQAKLDYSLSFERDNPLVLTAQHALGLSDAQMDTLWMQAAAIQ